MAKNLENINTARKLAGLTPLDKLPEGNGAEKGDTLPPPPPPLADNPPIGDPPAKDPPLIPPPADVDDAQILEALKKRGIPVNALDDLIPKEDPLKLAETREANKLSFALTKGLFSTKEHEGYIRDSANKRDLVFADYYDQAKADNPELTNEQIQEEFEEKYGISLEPNSWKHKRGAQEIELLADKILKDRYGKIYKAEDAYSQHELTEKDKKTRNQTILAKAPVYKNDVETAFTNLKKMKIALTNDESVEVDVPVEVLDEVKALLLDNDTAATQIVKGATAQQIQALAQTMVLQRGFNALAFEVAKQYNLKKQAGTRGIPPVGPQRRSASRELTDNQKAVLADHGISETDLPPINAN